MTDAEPTIHRLATDAHRHGADLSVGFGSSLVNVEEGRMIIDGVEYVRADSVAAEIGDMRIIVADRGWIFVGQCEDQGDGSVIIRNARNIRKWGTTCGLGELVNGPTSETVVDLYGTVKTTPIVSIAVMGGW